MKKAPPSLLMKRLHISAETIHLLYPDLPLNGLPTQDGLYDSISAFDLARELGIHKPARNTEENNKVRRNRPNRVAKGASQDVLVVGGKEYFSVQITAQRTGYSPDELFKLTRIPDTTVQYVYHDLDNGQIEVLFLDVDSVKTYRPRHK